MIGAQVTHLLGLGCIYINTGVLKYMWYTHKATWIPTAVARSTSTFHLN